MLRQRATEYFRGLQDRLCSSLAEADGKGEFRGGRWKHPDQGGGETRVLEKGALFEKAAVNFSEIGAPLTSAAAARLQVNPQRISATGISLILHPSSPLVPAVHLNLRYLELADGDGWFGGGTDLTPCYLVEEDVRHFHRTLKEVCDRHGAGYYAKFKRWCDEYFFIPHRGESRGVGGVFFDYQRSDPDLFFLFVKDMGDSFLGAYLPIVERRRNEPWGEQEKEWQLLRRGRYVEFNLVCDRGTLFGLETQGRTDSILASLPPHAAWAYSHEPPAGSREADLLSVLRIPRDWA